MTNYPKINVEIHRISETDLICKDIDFKYRYSTGRKDLPLDFVSWLYQIAQNLIVKVISVQHQ